MIIYILILVFIFSIVMISKGSDWITDSLIPVAQKLGTSYIAVSTLLVSIMISTPEIISSIYSFFLGHGNIGLGLIIGSVIVNIGLGVGLSAAIKPLLIESSVVIRDGMYLIIIAIIVMIMGSDLTYSKPEGLILLFLFVPYALNVWYFEKSRPSKSRTEKLSKIQENLDLIGAQISVLKLSPSILTFFLGTVLLLLGSYLFSFSLIEIGRILPIPELFIGVFFGALGTGIPNIAAAVQGTIKGYKDVAITETFGSNIFTLLITLGIFILLNPLQISAKIFYFDLLWMIVIHVLMIAFIIKGYKYKEESITRLEGFILFFFYLGLLFVNAFGFR